MNWVYEHLERVLPLGSQLLWDDWLEKPAVYISDLDGDGQEEMIVSFTFDDEVYTSTFRHNYSFWYVTSTLKEDNQIRVRGIDLFPASVKTVNGMKWGYINHKGKFVSPLKYEDAEDYQANGLAAVKINGKYGLINRYGQYIVTPKYNSINPFSEGRAIVMEDKGFKIINLRGKVLTKKTYSYIGNFKNGRAVYAGTNEEGKYLYGFLNRQGKEVTPLKYESATDFNEGKSIVRLDRDSYELIDRNGKILHSFPYSFVGPVSEGKMAFQQEGNGKYGYLNTEGQIIIQPAFDGAQAFKDGRAVVNMSKPNFQYGLIDTTGKFVIQPSYNDISILGENRVALGKAINKEQPYLGSVYAIADLNGHILTDFKYTNVSEYKEGFASATDTKSTFFLDKSGQIAKNLPVAKGKGTLSLEGALVKGMIDMRLRYYRPNGTIVWTQNQIIPLNNQFRVIERKYNPNKDYLVYYPEIQGMRFEAMQKKVNVNLAKISGVKEVDSNKQLESSYTGQFDLSFFKNHLLVLELNGYDYPFGAAHGMPSKVYAHVDLDSGAFYELKDLFQPESHYVEVLNKIIGEQIKTNPEYSYVWPDSYKGITPNQPFYVDATHLYIYFVPYEIAPYAAGFPTFKIPFTQIDSIINKNGPFWRAFH